MTTTESDNYDLLVLLPAKDEELTIRESILRFGNCLPNAHIIVIDNNSGDSTAKFAIEAMQELKINGRVISELKAGKGNAIWAGLCAAKASVYVMCDSDCTYPIEDVHKIIEPIAQGTADFVIGDRLSNGGYDEQNVRLFHGYGNVLLTSMVNICFSRTHADVMSGFKAFSGRFAESYNSHAAGFDIEVDLAIHAAISSYVALDVPISYQSRPLGSFSKLNTVKDGYASIKRIFIRFVNHRCSLSKTAAGFSSVTGTRNR